MYQTVLIFHVIAAIAVIGLVLIQQGKGADIGAAFGAGASNTVFGSQGSGGFLFKTTGGFAVLFFVTSLLLGSISAKQYTAGNVAIGNSAAEKKVVDDIPVPVKSTVTKSQPVKNTPSETEK